MAMGNPGLTAGADGSDGAAAASAVQGGKAKMAGRKSPRSGKKTQRREKSDAFRINSSDMEIVGEPNTAEEQGEAVAGEEQDGDHRSLFGARSKEPNNGASAAGDPAEGGDDVVEDTVESDLQWRSPRGS